MQTVYQVLSKIKKGQENKKKFISIIQPSKLLIKILEIFIKEGLILNYTLIDEKKQEYNIYLKYFKEQPLINQFVILSKPSLRTYFTHKDIETFYKKKSSNIILILSTTKGLLPIKKYMLDTLKIGGEPLFYIT